jgi:hypothetical protein
MGHGTVRLDDGAELGVLVAGRLRLAEDDVVVRDGLAVDLGRAVRGEDDAEHGLDVGPGRRLRQIEGHGLRNDELRRDHEDDQEHEDDVDQRGDVDPRDRLARTLVRSAGH